MKERGSGYDKKHPFKDSDPRLALTVIYPGANYVKATALLLYSIH